MTAYMFHHFWVQIDMNLSISDLCQTRERFINPHLWLDETEWCLVQKDYLDECLSPQSEATSHLLAWLAAFSSFLAHDSHLLFPTILVAPQHK